MMIRTQIVIIILLNKYLLTGTDEVDVCLNNSAKLSNVGFYKESWRVFN